MWCVSHLNNSAHVGHEINIVSEQTAVMLHRVFTGNLDDDLKRRDAHEVNA